MKRKLIAALLVFFSIIITNSYAQNQFELPQNIELKAKEDYVKYEKDFIEAAKWLEHTDLNKEKDKRQHVNAFIIK